MAGRAGRHRRPGAPRPGRRRLRKLYRRGDVPARAGQARLRLPADGVPEYLRFLPGQECLAEEGNLPFAPQTALAVDVSSPDMLSQYRALFEACPHRAVLDHHQSNPLFGQVNCVQPGSAAAGELALALIEALGVALTREMATCIFAAVCSDTGNFNFSNTTAEAFEAAATCVRAGADVDEITGRIFRTRTQARTRLLGMALGNLRFDGAWPGRA